MQKSGVHADTEEAAIDELDEAVEQPDYRTLSKGAVFALVLALVSLPLIWLTVGDDNVFFVVLLLPLIAAGLGLVALVRIRRNPEELSGKLPALIGTLAGVLCVIGGAGRHGYILATEVPDGYQRITWYELKARGEDRRLPFPAEVFELAGKKVFIKGYVHPSVSGTGPVQQCMVVGDMGTCCFGGNPKLTERIDVVLEKDLRISYGTRLRKFGGTFLLRVNPHDPRTFFKPDDGSQGAYYVLQVDHLE